MSSRKLLMAEINWVVLAEKELADEYRGKFSVFLVFFVLSEIGDEKK